MLDFEVEMLDFEVEMLGFETERLECRVEVLGRRAAMRVSADATLALTHAPDHFQIAKAARNCALDIRHRALDV